MSDAPSELFEILSARPRRRVLFQLVETDSIRIPNGLRRRGQARSRGAGGDHSSPELIENPDPDDESQERLELQFHHTHLPKLENDGLIEWDRERKIASRGPKFDEVEPALRLLSANSQLFSDDLF